MMFEKNKPHCQENKSTLFMTMKDKDPGIYVDGVKLYGPFFIALHGSHESKIISSIGYEHITDGTKLITAYMPALNKNNDDFRDILGFFNKDCFHDNLSHVAFYTKSRPSIYNDQTYPGLEVCWDLAKLSEERLTILPFLMAYQGTVSISNTKLFNLLKTKINTIIARMPEEEKILYNEYLKDVTKQMTHHSPGTSSRA